MNQADNLRILFVSNFYPPHSLGGVQLYTHGIASELQNRGHSIHVTCAGEWDSGPKHLNKVTNYVYEGVPVRRIDLNWAKAPEPFRYLYDNAAVRLEMERLLTEFRPDVVHVTSPSHLSAGVIFTAKATGFPVALTLPDYWMICPRFTLQHAAGHICDGNVTPWQCTECLAWGAKIYRWPRQVLPKPAVRSLLSWVGNNPFLARQRGVIGMVGDMEHRRRTMQQAFKAADVILAISEYLKDVFAQSHQLPAERIGVHEWGLPTSQVQARPQSEPGDPIRIAFFGRLTAIKGVHVLLRAFNGLRGNVQLHIYGGSDSDDDYASMLRDLASSNPRIQFHGKYNRLDMPNLLASCDLVVVPSTVPETYNLVVREALLARVPVVASRIGAISDAVKDGENGLLVSPGDVSELVLALQRLLDEPLLREQLASGFRSVKTIAQECDELVAIYESLESGPVGDELA